MSLNTDYKNRFYFRWLREKNNFNCFYCGIECLLHHNFKGNPRKATIDHVMPISKGGSNKKENLVLACYKCNQLKRDQIWEPNEQRNGRVCGISS